MFVRVLLYILLYVFSDGERLSPQRWGARQGDLLLTVAALQRFFSEFLQEVARLPPRPRPRSMRITIVTLRQARSALHPLSPPHLTLLLLAAWLGGCAADDSPPLSPPSPSSPPAPSPPLSPPPLSSAWDITVSGPTGDYHTALGSPTALNFIFQGTTASGARRTTRRTASLTGFTGTPASGFATTAP